MLSKPCYQDKLVAIAVDEAHCVNMWGEQFRMDFSLLGQLRSIVPSRVHVLATTATATMATFLVVRDRLFMQNPCIVAMPPEKIYIKYSVTIRPNFEKNLEEIIENIATQRTKHSKMIIFCQRYKDCYELYLRIKYAMKEKNSEPEFSPDIHDNHLVTMYHSAATQKTKEKIFSSFTEKGNKLRILISTSAFCLGIDCPDIGQILHWGPPADLDTYVQETGRAGRDGDMSCAHLLFGRLSQHTGANI